MEARTFLVQKYLDPEGAYKESLAPLSRPDAFELLASEPGRVVERRELAEGEVQEVLSRPHVAAVEPDYEAKAPEPPEVEARAAQSLTAAQARALHGVDALHAKGIRGKGMRIGVIDTGVHRELARRLGGRLLSVKNYTGDPDGYDTDSMHGTYCISVIAAICPEAEIRSYKGLSTFDGSGSYSGIVKATEEARRDGCTHLSKSLGGPFSSTLNNAVDAADAWGVAVAVAAGNEQRGRTDYVADSTSPASAAGALTTAAAGSDYLVASFSNWGACVDASALGVSVQCPDHDIAGLSGFWSGTSMATPHLAAIHALLMSAGYAKDEARKALLSACKDTPEPVHEEGYGFALADAALAKLAPDEPAPYHPELPRVYKSRVDDVPLASLGDFVMVARGRGEVGVFRRKGG